MNISESELLDALRDAATQPDARPDGALTRTELCEALGIGRGAIQARLVALVKSGQMECIWIPTTDIAGRASRVPAYRMIAPSIVSKIAPKKKGKR